MADRTRLMQCEEPQEFPGLEFGCRGHARSCGAEEADDKCATERFDHEPGVAIAGVEGQLSGIKQRPQGNPDDAPECATEEEDAKRFRSQPVKSRDGRGFRFAMLAGREAQGIEGMTA